MDAGPDIVTRLLDAAEKLCRTRGYNGFSYRDLTEAVGIKTASIHYHFPTKGDLGRALMVRYRQRFESARLTIERQEATGIGRLRRLLELLQAGYKLGDTVCLAGIFVAEADSVAETLRDEVRRFFTENEAWLAGCLTLGVRQGNVRPGLPADEMARTIFGAIEGAILASRAFGDGSRFTSAAQCILGLVAA